MQRLRHVLRPGQPKRGWRSDELLDPGKEGEDPGESAVLVGHRTPGRAAPADDALEDPASLGGDRVVDEHHGATRVTATRV